MLPKRIGTFPHNNSIAKQISNILSHSQKRNIPTLSKYNPIFQFELNSKRMKFTSVRGHIFDHELPEECKNWHNFDNRKILTSEVPMVRKLGPDMQSLAQNLQNLSRQSKELILWLDCDRQGEAIAFEVMEICLKRNPYLKIARARFSAVTPQDVWNAYQNLIQPNEKEANAVKYRTQIDFRLGCTFTRYQTITFNKIYRIGDKSVISYGPCQMPTLSFVVDRYLQIKNFKPEKFWFLEAICVINEQTGIPFSWARKNVKDERMANQFLVKIMEQYNDYDVRGKVKSKKTNKKKKYRPYPLITVSFQKLATNKLKMSSAEAMQIAEKLYQKGFISYPRTQTNAFPKTMNLKNHLEKLKGSNEVFDLYIDKLLSFGKYQNPKVGNKDDQAHSPIHPTKIATQDQLSPAEWRVYDLISRHFFACCSQDANGEQFEVKADIGGEEFKASYLTILQKNYLEIYPFQKWVQTSFPAQIPDNFPVMLTLKDGKTTPPSYLSESDLIDLMEKNQIGTDSTIHEHIQTIQKRQYAIKTNNTFKPTDLGAGLVRAYRKLSVELPQCDIRRKIQQHMNKISLGELELEEATRETLDSMIPIYEKLRQIKEEWILAMKEFVEDNNDLKKICFPKENDQGHISSMYPIQNNDNQATNNYYSNAHTSIRCYRCNKPGHIAPDCPQKNNNNYTSNSHVQKTFENSRTNTNYKCFKCGKPGHIAPNCPQGKTSTKAADVKCFNCGQAGHFSNNCPKKNGEKKTEKKKCPECGVEGRHPKMSACSMVKRRNNAKSCK